MSLDLFSLAGKRALITGSSRGIGFALAEGMGKAGAEIVVNGRDTAKTEEAVAKLKAAGVVAQAAVFDVTDADEVRAHVTKLDAERPIDILINNAGMQHREPLETFPEDAFDRLIKLNLYAVFHVGKAVAQGMIARKRGKIINIASVQAALARPTIAPYVASKGAVANLTKGMATDWAKYGLQINAIAPGYFKTELNQALVDNPEFSAWIEKRTPAGRWGNVPELVGAAIFLSSDASSYVNGHTLYVDGGMTICL